MQLLALAADVVTLVVAAAQDPVPEAEDVKAGWLAFGIFLALAAAVALLGWGLTKQLGRARRNRDAGMFGPVDDEPDAPGGPERRPPA